MSEAELRQVFATVSGEGTEEFEVSEIILSAAVNSLPSCVIKGARADSSGKLATASDGAVDFSIAKTARKLSEDQNAMFRPSGEMEVTVELEVKSNQGNSSKLKFEGLSSAPGMDITTGKVLEQKTIIHPDKRMSSLNLSIYELVKEYGGEENRPTTDINTNTPVISGMIDPLIHWTLNSGIFEVKAEEEGFGKTLKDTHDKNIKIYNQVVKPILQRSTNTALGFNSVWGESDFGQSMVNIMHSQPDFLQSLLGHILPTLVFQLVCNFDDKEGESEIKHSKVNRTPEFTEEIDVVSMSSTLGSPGELPLGQIIMSGTRLSEYGGPTPGGGTTDVMGAISHFLSIQSAWPNKKHPEHGHTRHIVAPRWLEAVYTPGDNIEVKPGLRGEQADRNAEADHQDSLDNMNSLESYYEETGDTLNKIPNCLRDWAQKHYIEQALQNHRASVTIPLDLNWGTKSKPIGTVYDISASSNKEGNAAPVKLFDGYLRSVVHNVGVGPQQGRAFTTLAFTHVKGAKWDSTNMVPSYGHDVQDWVE